MKRSEINAIMREAISFMAEMKFSLPPFAYFSPQDWEGKGKEYDEIRDNMLGWDITDYGKGDFHRLGLLLFTIRNGNLSDPRYKKPYAEKVLLSEVGQVTPCHFHWNKMEDIINRGGGTLVIACHNSGENGELLDTPVNILTDGRSYFAGAGEQIRLRPGESITLMPGQYHSFWGEGGRVLIGEVSSINDDNADNRFLEEMGRFPDIEEDERPLHLLVTDYARRGAK